MNHNQHLQQNQTNWIFNNVVITPETLNTKDFYGFVYKITNLTNHKFYIGRKNFRTQRKKQLPKKLQSTDKRKKTYTIEVKESDWIIYNSSCKTLVEEINKTPQLFKKEILLLCKTEKQLTYYEQYYQMIERVLFVDSYNDNIAGKYFTKDFI